MNPAFVGRCIGLCILIVIASEGRAADPPKILSLSPDNGATDVDAKITELRILFDRDMVKGSHSVCGGGPAFPELTDKPAWKDARTLVLKVKLKPDHAYQMSLNCPSAMGFRSKEGAPLEPTPWTFTTAAARSRKDQRKLNEQSLAELMKVLKNNYSYYDRLKLDWRDIEDKARDKLVEAGSNATWVKRAAEMLAVAQDIHLWINYGGKTTGTYQRTYEPNFNLAGVEAILGKLDKRNENTFVANKNGVFYLLIPSWSGDSRVQIDALQSILAEIPKDAKGVILDVRPNGGGDELLARGVASWFVEGEHVYSKNRYRVPVGKGKFGQMLERKITGNPTPNRFDGPVAVLMGPANLSSNESFLMMMKQGKRVKLIGGPSGGSSGNPKPFKLANGVEVFVPSWQDFLPDGSPLEGKGIQPDILIKSKPDDFLKGDPVLSEALKVLRIGSGTAKSRKRDTR